MAARNCFSGRAPRIKRSPMTNAGVPLTPRHWRGRRSARSAHPGRGPPCRARAVRHRGPRNGRRPGCDRGRRGPPPPAAPCESVRTGPAPVTPAPRVPPASIRPEDRELLEDEPQVVVPAFVPSDGADEDPEVSVLARSFLGIAHALLDPNDGRFVRQTTPLTRTDALTSPGVAWSVGWGAVPGSPEWARTASH